MTDPFRSFYQSHPPDLTSLSDISRRHFRILLPRGTFLKIPDRITSAAVLKRWLVRYRPSDVYYSTSCWLAPETLGRREGTPLSANIFLSSDIVFDIDQSPFSWKNLDRARLDTIRLLGFCRDEGLPVRYCAFSGSKGFHVVCEDTVRYPMADPFAREDQARARRKEILARVQDAGISVDPRITPDTRRIIRVPGTINSKSGYACTVLTEDQVLRPVREILNSIPHIPVQSPLIPSPGDDSSLRGFRIMTWLCHRFGVRSKPPGPVLYSTFVTNAVPGIDRQVPVFIYPPRRDLKAICNELARLQQVYGLPDLFVFTSETEIQAICLRTFPISRLRKIIRASTSSGMGTLLRYKQLFFRVGETRDSAGRVCAGSPSFVRKIGAGAEHDDHFVSRPHLRFLSGFVPVAEYPRMHGEGEIFLTHTVTETV